MVLYDPNKARRLLSQTELARYLMRAENQFALKKIVSYAGVVAEVAGFLVVAKYGLVIPTRHPV